MASSPMVGRGFPRTGSNARSAIALAAGRKEAKIVRDAIAQVFRQN